MNTREVVEKYFKTVNAGNWDGWLTLFDDNIVLIEPIGTIEGIENLREAAGGLKKGYSKFQNKPIETIVEGNCAVVICQIEAITDSGDAVNVKVANTYQIENGKIVHQENFFDSVHLKPFLDQFAQENNNKEQNMNTREVIEKFHEYASTGNWDGWLSLFDDNAILDESIHGHMKGKERLRLAADALKNYYSEFKNTPMEIVIEGNRGVSVWHIEGITASGYPVDAKGVNVYKVENGKIIHMENYLDPAPFKPFDDQFKEE